MKPLCSIRTRFTDVKLFECLVLPPLFPSSPLNISLWIQTFIPTARGMRRGHCTAYRTVFRSPNALLIPVTSSLRKPGHIRLQSSLPARSLGPALLHGVLGPAGEWHRISPGFIPSVINDDPEGLKGSCLCFSCGSLTRW